MYLLKTIIPYPAFIVGFLPWACVSVMIIVILCNAVAVGSFHKRASQNEFAREPDTVYGLSQDGLTFLYATAPSFIWIFINFWLFLFLAGFWLKAGPTNDWQEQIKPIDTAIILGFGFETDGAGHIQPGESNQFLLQWALDHTNADTLLVQEGIWAAACKTTETKCEKSGRRLVRIHHHDNNIDVNTFQAAFCTLEKMEKLGKKSAVLVAHDLQLERAAWDFDKLKQSREEWSGFNFVVPEIPKVPSPKKSDQLRTRSRSVYTFFELFGSRLRDYFSSTPEKCIAPAPSNL